MADAFSSVLSEVKAPSGPDAVKRAEFGSSRVIKGEIGMALEGAGSLLEGVATLGSFIAGKETERQIDRDIDEATKAAGVNIGGGLNAELSRLSRFQEAAVQKGDARSADMFNLTLAASAKTWKTNNPHRVGEYDRALRERGITDPRIALIKDRASREKEIADAQFKMENEILASLVKTGIAIHSVPGDISTPINREASLALYREAVLDAERSKQAEANIGIRRDTSGKPSIGLGDLYLKNMSVLRETAWNSINRGAGPLFQRAKFLINSNASPEQIQEIARQAFNELSEFRKLEKARTINLNSEEDKNHMEYIDSLIGPMAQTAFNIQNTKDLSAMDAEIKSAEAISNNYKSIAHRDAPDFMRMKTVVGDAFMGSFVEKWVQSKEGIAFLGRFSEKIMPPLAKMFEIDGMLNPISLGKPDPKTGKDDKEAVLSFSASQIQDSIERNTLVKDEKDANTWSGFHVQIFNAFYGKSDLDLTAKDISSVAKQFSTPNYFSNLVAINKLSPENGKKLGGFVFDVLQKNINNLSQELQDSQGISIKIADGKFVADAPIVDIEGGVESPIITKRLNEINSSIPTLLYVKQFKETYKNMPETELLSQIAQNISTGFRNKPREVIDTGVLSEMTPAQQLTYLEESIAGKSPRGIAKAIQDLFPFADPKLKTKEQPAIKQEEKRSDFVIGPIDLKEDKLNNIVKAFENRHLVGKRDDGTWIPHKAIEGGRDNIGYGHKLTKEEAAGGYVLIDGKQVLFKDGISDAHVETLLAQDLKISTTFVNKEFPWLKPKQAEAVSSLVYNVGVREFKSSKAYKALKDGATSDFIKEAFDKPKGYVYINKKVSNGLVKRRALEKEMFLTGE